MQHFTSASQHQLANALSQAASNQDGPALQALLGLNKTQSTAPSGTRHSAVNSNNGAVWTEIALHHSSVATNLAQNNIVAAWESMNAVVTAFLRFFSGLTNSRWCVSTCVMLLSFHRALSLLADDAEQKGARANGGTDRHKQHKYLEECARQLSKTFSICVGDRSTEEEESRKWATYDVVGLLFRTYFRLKSTGLCRNILRALNAANLPPFESFPRAQRVTFKYYVGLLAFLNEDYNEAESNFTYAFENCHAAAHHNQAMILRYLIPCGLLRGKLPSSAVLARFASLSDLYRPFVNAIRSGNVRAYDDALASQSTERILVRVGTYLAVERAREICLRVLFKRVYRAKDSSSRVRLQEFHCGLGVVGVELDILETEWLVASQIAKGYMRGYISHPHMMAVLSAQDPFPKLTSIPMSA